MADITEILPVLTFLAGPFIYVPVNVRHTTPLCAEPLFFLLSHLVFLHASVQNVLAFRGYITTSCFDVHLTACICSWMRTGTLVCTGILDAKILKIAAYFIEATIYIQYKA